MKRILCAALAVLMLCACAAFAEDMLAFTSGDIEEKLGEMIPVLDSLAVSMNVGSDDATLIGTYDAEDSRLIWNQLWLLSANWLSNAPEYQVADGLKIPSDVMEACARASFGSRWNPLPAIPTEGIGGTVVYDPATDSYRVSLGGDDGHYIIIERYAADGQETVVNCGLYEGETDLRRGGLTARLENAAEGALYPFVVMEAHAEQTEDFEGLWATRCLIRAEEDTFEATAIIEPSAAPTVVPTATPVVAEYRTLSSGSRGEDVRALQSRLNQLGYECGYADGVFGGGTREAVRLFQEAIKWGSRDGVATPELQRRLFSASAPKYNRYASLQKGSSGTRVENLQDRLRELGYTCAPIDGNYGDRLAAAVKRFQRRAGLKADGIAGQATLRALEKSNAPRCREYIDLQKGDSGSRVTEMQRRLRDLGYYDHHTSGKYDSNTVEAVAAFKEDYDLSGSGKSVDADIIELMFEDLDPVDPDEDIDEEDDDDYVDDDDDYVDDGDDDDDDDDYVDDGDDDDDDDDYVDDGDDDDDDDDDYVDDDDDYEDDDDYDDEDDYYED